MTRRRRALPVPALLTAAVLLTGCGGDGEPAASTGSASAGSASASTAAGGDGGGGTGDPGTEGDGREAPPFPSDLRPDEQDASADARVTVSDIRTGRHDGFDRVVFEVGGAGLPGWDVRYVDDPASQGSGDPVDVAGDAVLQVTITGAGYPYDTGVEEFSGPDPLPGSGTAVVTEVAFDATFEGTTVAFVGTTARSPFRVYLLEGPARVVVEVADPT
ncbi:MULTISPECIES: AMIN-like domain-containing (lipo)protein [unclassified Blastococcus]